MIRCVDFDFDGTLVDSNAIKRDCFFETFTDLDPGGETVAHVLDVVQPGDHYDIVREIATRLHGRGAVRDGSDVEATAERLAAERQPEPPGATGIACRLSRRSLARELPQ